MYLISFYAVPYLAPLLGISVQKSLVLTQIKAVAQMNPSVPIRLKLQALDLLTPSKPLKFLPKSASMFGNTTHSLI